LKCLLSWLLLLLPLWKAEIKQVIEGYFGLFDIGIQIFVAFDHLRKE
jgi:hypothetical protein